MGKNTAYGNHRAINPNYFEQKEQEAGQVDSGNKNYSRRLHFINLQPCTAEDYYNSLKDWSEIEPFKKPKKKYVNKEAGIFWGLRIKAFFSVAVKVELDEKKKQADAIYVVCAPSSRQLKKYRFFATQIMLGSIFMLP